MNIIVSCDQLAELLRAAPTLLHRTVSATRARRGKASARLFCMFCAYPGAGENYYRGTSIQGTPLGQRQVSLAVEVSPEWRLGWGLLNN